MIVQIPDPILTQQAALVKEVTEVELKELKYMHEKMMEKDGVGIAAPQVGISKQMAIIRFNDTHSFPIINPVIVSYSRSELCACNEGCLSIPNKVFKVRRYKRVTIKYLGTDNNYHTYKASGLVAEIIQHEIDHLKGIVISDKGRLWRDYNVY